MNLLERTKLVARPTVPPHVHPPITDAAKVSITEHDLDVVTLLPKTPPQDPPA